MRFDTKHPQREKPFAFKNLYGGYNEENAAEFLEPHELSSVCNMYPVKSTIGGETAVTWKIRQGSTKINLTALSGAADVEACFYYKAKSKYIMATSSALYYCTQSTAPVKICDLDGVPTFTEFNDKLSIHDSGITKIWNGAVISADTIAFVDSDPDTITDSGSAFVTSGFEVGQDILISGGTNDGDTYTIASIAAGTITLIAGDATTAEAAGSTITITGYHKAHSLYEDEVLAAGDNSTVNFTGNFTNTPIVPGSITISFTDSTAKTITDDGQGALTGNVDGGGTNTINYANGAYDFTCDGAPDSSTNVTVTYKEQYGGPKSKAGLVRKSRLYVWGDSDNPERIWNSGTNDPDDWGGGTSTNSGYTDIDENTGQDLIGCTNLFDSIFCVKRYSMHRIDNYPGDSDYAVSPVMEKIGSPAYRSVLVTADLLVMMSDSGVIGLSPTEAFGDIQKNLPLSKAFATLATKAADGNTLIDYNPELNQLWIQMTDPDHGGYLPNVYVICLDTGGQVARFKFAFAHSCFKYVNGEMLVGGTDGNLYKMSNDESTFKDNTTSYSSDTYLKTAYTDWDLPSNNKHNKRLELKVYGKSGLTGSIKLYKDRSTAAFKTITLPASGTGGEIYSDGQQIEIYDMQSMQIGIPATSEFSLKPRFNYKLIMAEVSDFYGAGGGEFKSVEFSGAIVGD